MGKNGGISIYGERPNARLQENMDKQVVDAVAKPLIGFNRRLFNIINQMINTQGPNYDGKVIQQRLALLKQEINTYQITKPEVLDT